MVVSLVLALAASANESRLGDPICDERLERDLTLGATPKDEVQGDGWRQVELTGSYRSRKARIYHACTPKSLHTRAVYVSFKSIEDATAFFARERAHLVDEKSLPSDSLAPASDRPPAFNKVWFYESIEHDTWSDTKGADEISLSRVAETRWEVRVSRADFLDAGS